MQINFINKRSMWAETFKLILNNETEKKKESWGKNSNDESDSRKNEISYLNSLKSFEFEPKTNIRDIDSSSSDDEEESNEDKVKQMENSEWCE